MPEVLANATEAVVAAWTIEPGTAFTVGQTIAEIETEKALVDLPAEQDGILGRIIALPGDATRVGAPIAVLVTLGETDAEIDAALGLSGSGSVPPVAEVPSTAPVTSAPAAQATVMPARLFASPLARRLARENGVDLTGVRPSGPGGRIVRADVEAALVAIQPGSVSASPVGVREDAPAVSAEPAALPVAPPAASDAPGGYLAIPHTGMRRAIARRLTESKSTVPHFYLTADCRVDELIALRSRINATSSVKVSLNDFVVKAAARAFAEVPESNVTWTDTHLRQWESVDIAVAVATEGGLLTPVVRGVQDLGLGALSGRIAELVQRARDGRLRQDELEGGSFAVTNLGMYGVTDFSAILNPPQSGILAVGAAKQVPVVIEGELAVANVMRCTLSVDHRALDGVLAARWLSAFVAAIESPLSILV
ncbi:dihydrolipoamide acetyltransferase family protein [Diaminobutyricibacter sp. McL0618]|uniref:dihydrolipoamide acetyltransferase family protein n=1 Tax=Leifsonia sp. McL0618 TaxID=3415677 RepID=UPI003CF728CE